MTVSTDTTHLDEARKFLTRTISMCLDVVDAGAEYYEDLRPAVRDGLQAVRTLVQLERVKLQLLKAAQEAAAGQTAPNRKPENPPGRPAAQSGNPMLKLIDELMDSAEDPNGRMPELSAEAIEQLRRTAEGDAEAEREVEGLIELLGVPAETRAPAQVGS